MFCLVACARPLSPCAYRLGELGCAFVSMREQKGNSSCGDHSKKSAAVPPDVHTRTFGDVYGVGIKAPVVVVVVCTCGAVVEGGSSASRKGYASMLQARKISLFVGRNTADCMYVQPFYCT